MKTLLLAVSGMMLMISGMACAQFGTSVMDQEMANGQRAQVNMRETRIQFNSIMTDKERARIAAAQARAPRPIAREEYVDQGKRRR